jgi:hypothetical protein
MKKKIALILCALTLPILSACGKEPESTNFLTCKETQLNGAYVKETIIKYNYDGTEVVGTDLKAIIDLSGRSAKDVGCESDTIAQCTKDLIEQMKNNCSGETFIENCKITNQTESGFTFTANVKNNSLKAFFSPLELRTDKATMSKQLKEKKNYSCSY